MKRTVAIWGLIGLGVALPASLALTSVLSPQFSVLASLAFLALGVALAADRETDQKEAGVKLFPVATNTVIFKGGLVAINSGGFAAPAADTASFRVVGVAMENANNNPGANGAKSVRVVSGRLHRFAATSITQAMVGTVMYVVDDQTFDDGLGTNAVKAGQLAEFVSTTEGWLFIPEGGLGRGTADADADATYSANETTLINALKARLNDSLHFLPWLLLGGGLLGLLAQSSVISHQLSLIGLITDHRSLITLLSLLAFGAVVNEDTLKAIRTDFQAIFLESYQGLTTRWPDVATEFPNSAQFLDLSWLGEVPAMKEWVDARVLAGLRRFRYEIENKRWEATLEVERTAIERDQLGVYRPRIAGLGQEAKRHPEELVSNLMNNGGSSTLGLAFDGLAFYHATRVVGESGTIANTLTGTGSTQAQFQADYVAAKAAMRGFKNDKGKPFNPNLARLLIVVPPGLEFVAKQTLNAAIISQTGNILVGDADLWVSPYLSDANDWFLHNIGGPIKPFAVSMESAAILRALDNLNSDHVFKNDRFLYGADGRYNAGYLLPWLSVRTTNT